jgi:serine phosphatase RsbU (regulator of sigma subunit)/tetratricopeptide (TPR) repeat protein
MKGRHLFIFFILICCCRQGLGQNHAIDSLKEVLKREKDDTSKINTLNLLSSSLLRLDKIDTSLFCADDAQKLAEKYGYKKGLATAWDNKAYYYWFKGNYPAALEYSSKALAQNQQIGNKAGTARSLNMLAAVYGDQGNYSKGLEYEQKTLAAYEEIGDEYWIAMSTGNIGDFYMDLGNYGKALEFENKALDKFRQIGNKHGIAANLNNLGSIYIKQGDYPKALTYCSEALRINRESKDKRDIAINLLTLGNIYTKQRNYSLANAYMDSGITVAKNIEEKEIIKSGYSWLAELDSAQGDYKKGWQDYKMFISMKDSLVNEAKVQAEMNYEFEQKQLLEKAEQDKKDLQVEADKHKQVIITSSVAVGLLLVLVFAGFIFRSLRITRKQKELIGKQKAEVEEQKHLVEEKNKDILDSITYAKRLQDAILPPLSLIKQFLPESFLFYKPKDIVAGDFYWMERTGDNILIAAADCTGHGVPGAMVSVVCSNALNRTVKEFKITEPGKILDKVRELVLETFEKSEDNVQDGMDISLCCINTKTNEAQWSGAYNSLWYIHGGEVVEVPADKQPIGKVDKPLPFNTHNLNLQEGDTLYLFTDGYADQFGGPKGKKFKYKQLQELLLANASKPMEEQKKMLENTLAEWKGELEQVDDILVIGIRV